MAYSYLELTNMLLVRLNEAKLTSTTFANARNVQELAKNAINDSLFHIYDDCEELPFYYARDQVLSLVIGQTFYDFPASADKIDFDNIYVQANSTYDVKYKRIKPIPHDTWKRHMEADHYNISSTDYALPEFVFRTPDDQIGFTPRPKYAYNMLINYWMFPVALTAATDTTMFPDRYARILVDGAEFYLHKMRKDADSREASLEKLKTGIMKLRSLRTNRYTAMTDTRIPSNKAVGGGYIDA